MAAKTVAKRAAELGTDEEELVRALKALCYLKTFTDTKAPKPNRYWMSKPKKPALSLGRAADFLGLDRKDAKRALEASHPVSWNVKLITTAIFAFIEKHDHWPEGNDFRSANGLPSPGLYRDFARMHNWRVSPRDWWEREIAKDKRCGPRMAVTLRNVLARKEAIDRIGFQKFIKDGLAELIDKHPEYGALYRLPGETPTEPMVLLKVVNSTAEPDGTFADYYLRVPPEMTDVREALTWTFNGNEALGSQLYEPLVET